MEAKGAKKSLRNKLAILFNIVFGRTTMVVLSILVQTLFLLAVLDWFSEYMLIAYTGFTIFLGAVVIIIIFNVEKSDAYKLAWMLPVIVAPIFGTMFYLMMKLQYGTRYIEEQLVLQKKNTACYMNRDNDLEREIADRDRMEAGFLNYMYDKAGYPAYGESYVEYYPLGEDKFQALIRELKAAKEFIFMEYFIVGRGYVWDTILEILIEKAREGVEVRFMYDGMCSLVLLPYNYPKDLSKFGIKSKMFSPVRPVISTHQNNRDHRKIVVIDGHTAFTGGINLADEYINRIDRFGHWKDTSVMIKGEAVRTFTMMFLHMWNVDERKKETYDKYIASHEAIQEAVSGATASGINMQRGSVTIPYGDEPYDSELVGRQVYIDILNRAQDYVHIMTPYLIIDSTIRNALLYCASRGVETIIMMPHIPDKKYAYYLAKTYYSELLAGGVKIYEYLPGFVHAKVFVSDDIRATVGSINLDYRSLYLHFECGLYMYDNEVIRDINDDYMATLNRCIEITPQLHKKYPVWKKLIGRALRLIAPLM